jgi:hypothetical protein
MTPSEKLRWCRSWHHKPQLSFCCQPTPPSGWGVLTTYLIGTLIVVFKLAI